MKKRICILLVAMCMIVSFCAACSTKESGSTSEGYQSDGSTSVQGDADLENWPAKNMQVVVPWDAGTGADICARLVGTYWEKELGTTFVYDNRTGANGLIGATYYFDIIDDGILFMPQLFWSNMILTGNATFDYEDFVPINACEVDPSSLSVLEGAPYQTFEELDAAIKANPGQVRIGVAGGSTHSIMLDELISKLGWDVKVVLYDSAAEYHAALLGNHIDVIAAGFSGVYENEVPVLIGTQDRFVACPDVPTFSEVTGDPDSPLFITARFLGVSAKMKEDHPARFDRLVETMEKVYQSDDFIKAADEAGRLSRISWYGPEASKEMLDSLNDFAVEYYDALNGN